MPNPIWYAHGWKEIEAETMPINKALYPKDWPEISARIRQREGNCCKFCHVANGAIGARDRFGEWHDLDQMDSLNAAVGDDLFGEYPKIVRIILTVAHLDQNPGNNDESNLAALCQRCHLNHDRPVNLIKRHETYYRRRHNRVALAGQLPLPLADKES